VSSIEELLRPPTKEEVLRALGQFAADVSAHYGARLRGLYLFGSRARGDHGPYSDADVAVVLDADGLNLDREKWTLVDLAFHPGFDIGVHISPWPFTLEDWGRAEEPSAASLIRNAKRDALALPELA
jgi:antitoxin ChpS